MNSIQTRITFAVSCVVLFATVSAVGQTVTATLNAGSYPYGVAVNPVTNQIYVANVGGNTVTVIDGATNATTTVNVGSYPSAVAVNPVTNLIYVANLGDLVDPGTVTVIDGATNATATINVGIYPSFVVVNPVTNLIYVSNQHSNTVTVINGATNATSTINVGTNPALMAVNPATNLIYVGNYGSNTVSVINGATNSITATINVGTNPISVVANPVTNLIYVANEGSQGQASTVTVINGVSNTTTTVNVGVYPELMAVNPVTNQIYVPNQLSGTVTVIDGATNATSTVTTGTELLAVVVNPVTNQIYASNLTGNTIVAIDGATNTTTPITVGTDPLALAVNPVTNKIYVANEDSNTVMVIDGATNLTATINAGTFPEAVAVDPVTNQTYVANLGSNTVTVINGATNATTSISVGSEPCAVAINPVTNQIYVANFESNTVTVIDGATNATTTVNVGNEPFTMAVNPVTNQIYVANFDGNSITVIDGATNMTTTINAGSYPYGVAVNPVTNQIYVANYGSNTVTVINGVTNATTTVNVGTSPFALAVNSVTNQIYVANYYSQTVSVINGATNAATTVSVGANPSAVAVNSATNQIYVTNYDSNTVSVINGATNASTTVNVGTAPEAVAVNPVTNKIYVANYTSNNVTVIDGATNTTAALTAGTTPCAVAVNPVTNEIYVPNMGSNNVTVIDEEQVQPIPLEAEITALAGNQTGSMTPEINFTASSNFAPFAPNPDSLMFQVDTWQGSWTAATAQGNGAFSGTTGALQPGLHILYAYATDGLEATLNFLDSPLISNVVAYEFLVSPANSSLSPGSLNFGNQTIGFASAQQTVTLTNNSGGALGITGIAASGDYNATSNCGGTLDAGQTCTIAVTLTPTILGTDNGTLTVTDDNLGVNGTLQTVSLTGAGIAATTVSVTPISLSFSEQIVGTTSAAKKVTVKNTGTEKLLFSSTPVTITGANAGDFSETSTCTGSIAADSSCTVDVSFTPVATGTRNATLTVNDEAQNSPQTVSLSGTGGAQATLSPAALTFVSPGVGTASSAQNATLTNNLPSALAISITFTGSDPGDFSQTSTCGSSVPASSQCTISVTFTPQASGTRTATLNVNDSASNLSQTVSLTGSETQASLLYSLGASPDSRYPNASLIVDSKGNLYSTTYQGGANGEGTVFELSPEPASGCAAGTNTGNGWCESVLYSFGSSTGDGTNPESSLILYKNDLYGTTLYGGVVGLECSGRGCGTLFKLSPAPKKGCAAGTNAGNGWCESVLYSFAGAGGDGFSPYASLMVDNEGNLYGTTQYGGANDAGAGTVFELSPEPAGGCATGSNSGNGWCESVLYVFGIAPDGATPWGGVIMDKEGNLYGTTYGGDTGFGGGTVFKLIPEPASGCATGSNPGNGWCETVLYAFGSQSGDGTNPVAGLVMDSKGNLYGTTLYAQPGGGTVFEVTPSGVETVLWTFGLIEYDGDNLFDGVMRDSKGNLYGTAYLGGRTGVGMVFELSPPAKEGEAWGETILYAFMGAPGDGAYPTGGVIMDKSGNLFGTTYAGGTNGNGTVFEIVP